ncbi:MAG: hypothetical protein IMY88_01135 [Chloroflexi bacterium]|nr:hypothetical protein [Chloroflexota bacterium]
MKNPNKAFAICGIIAPILYLLLVIIGGALRSSRLGITYLTVGSRFVSILRKLRFQQVTQFLLRNLKNGRSSIDGVCQGAVNEVSGQQV